jgi:hypothetical protein
MDVEHSILPSIGTMRVIKAVPSCQRLVQLTEARCKEWRPAAIFPRGRRRLDASIARPGQRYRASYIGAPRPMKMGTASPWRLYEA